MLINLASQNDGRGRLGSLETSKIRVCCAHSVVSLSKFSIPYCFITMIFTTPWIAIGLAVAATAQQGGSIVQAGDAKSVQ